MQDQARITSGSPNLLTVQAAEDIEFLVKDASGDVYSTSDPLLLEN